MKNHDAVSGILQNCALKMPVWKRGGETFKMISKKMEAETGNLKSTDIQVPGLYGGEEYVKVKKSDWNKIHDAENVEII